jgi:uncharacterized delta-60 repeat protein
MSPIRKLCGVGVVLAVLLASPAQAGATAFGQGSNLVAAPGDRIVALGSDFSVARVLPDGEPDPAFGGDGIARARFPGFVGTHGDDALVQRDGKVVVVGYVTARCRPPRRQACRRLLALARFLRSGRLDPDFGGDGTVVTPRAGRGLAVTRLPSAKIAIAGRTANGLPMVARFGPGGGLDRGFGERGVHVIRSLPEIGELGFGRADTIVAQGRNALVVGVSGGAPDVPSRRGLLRLSYTGTTDLGFGGDGYVTELPPGAEFGLYGFSVAPLPDDSLLVATTTSEYPAHIALVRLRADGFADLGYGSSGVARGPSDFAVRFNVDLGIQPDGHAVVAAAGFQDMGVARFDPDGVLEIDFGPGGVQTVESWGAHASLALLGDGTIAAADANRQLSALIVARFAASGAPLGTFELNG